MSARVSFPALVTIVLALSGSGFGIVPSAVATPATHAASPTPTARIVVRPVTATGTIAPGFREATEQGTSSTVDCSTPEPSPAAVSRNIEVCAPTAAYAIACWKAASPRRVLCTRDPSADRVSSLPRSGTFAPTARAPRRNRAPLLLVLGDGVRCFIRDGGAWSTLRSHPRWYGTYACEDNTAVWSPPNATHYGVDESHPVWTVHTAPISGNGSVTVRVVRKAYFVGTQR